LNVWKHLFKTFHILCRHHIDLCSKRHCTKSFNNNNDDDDDDDGNNMQMQPFYLLH